MMFDAVFRSRLVRALLRRRIFMAGICDAGLSSLATFAVGFFASRSLQPVVLGAYAFALTTCFLVSLVPTQLVFSPMEIAAISYPVERRLRLLGYFLKLGIPTAFLAALAVPMWILFVPTIPTGAVRALTITAVACAVASPVQDHLRRMLHLAGVSWLAAATSLVQVVGAIGAIVIMSVARVQTWWIPIGALAFANVLSFAAGFVLALHARGRGTVASLPGLRGALRTGQKLLASGGLLMAAEFVVTAIVVRTAGAAIVGYAEAARIVGQPVWVLAMGLSAVLTPRSMSAAQERREKDARRISWRFTAFMIVVAAGYLAVAGGRWHWNVLARLVPNAYAVSGLVALTVIANVFVSTTSPLRAELLGGGKEMSLLRIEVVANAIRISVAATARVVGAFAIPGGLASVGVARWLAYQRVMRSVYAAEESGAAAVVHGDVHAQLP